MMLPLDPMPAFTDMHESSWETPALSTPTCGFAYTHEPEFDSCLSIDLSYEVQSLDSHLCVRLCDFAPLRDTSSFVSADFAITLRTLRDPSYVSR